MKFPVVLYDQLSVLLFSVMYVGDQDGVFIESDDVSDLDALPDSVADGIKPKQSGDGRLHVESWKPWCPQN